MSFNPIKINDRTYTLCGKRFQLYSLIGFHFNEDIEIDSLNDDSGLYCFTRDYNTSLSDDSSRFYRRHELLYLGMATAIDDRPLKAGHEKWEKLKKDGCNCLGIYLCKDGLKSKESEILDKYSFKENIKENEKVENKTKFVSED